jgi:transcriptional regulator with XRE-family HTH domain
MLHSLGRTVRLFRVRQGLTQKRYAKLVGSKHQHISAIERGHVNPSLLMLEAMAYALGLSTSALLAEAENAKRVAVHGRGPR